MSVTRFWDQVSETIEFSAPLDLDLIKSMVIPKARILDLGCGYGRIAARLKELGYPVVGYDSSAKLIERGKSSWSELDLRVGEASDIPESSGSFQCVVVSALFTAIPAQEHRADIVIEIRRLLAPGGIVCGVDFLQQNSVSYAEGGVFCSTAGIEMKHFQISELEALFSGFVGWRCNRAPTSSLSGSSAEVLQYSAQLPPSNAVRPDALSRTDRR